LTSCSCCLSKALPECTQNRNQPCTGQQSGCPEGQSTLVSFN
jgi:hypothetical protein